MGDEKTESLVHTLSIQGCPGFLLASANNIEYKAPSSFTSQAIDQKFLDRGLNPGPLESVDSKAKCYNH